MWSKYVLSLSSEDGCGFICFQSDGEFTPDLGAATEKVCPN